MNSFEKRSLTTSMCRDKVNMKPCSWTWVSLLPHWHTTELDEMVAEINLNDTQHNSEILLVFSTKGSSQD
jgi:hypothetical protein